MEEKAGQRRTGTGTCLVKTELACLPCFYGQIARSLHHAGVNGDRGRSILRKAEQVIEAASLDEVPARTTTLIHRIIRDETGVDPYRRIKDEYNLLALGRLPSLERRAGSGAGCLENGVRLAIAGNVIDFGIYETIDLDRSIDDAFRLPLPEQELLSFSHAVQRAHKIVYLCDNAGEIVFDRVLIKILHDLGKDVIAVVKGSPVINDATREDAEAAGLDQYATIVDNGNDGIGTLLEACSERFHEAFSGADLVISKGQANFETLVSEEDARVHFLFKVKCPVVASFLQRNDGDIILCGGRG